VTASATTVSRGGGVGRMVLVAGAVIGALLVIGVLSIDQRGGEPYDTSSTGPEGTRALVELVERFGARVEVAQAFPADADVAIAFTDVVPPSRVQDVRDWVAAGHTLVIADPSSELTPLADFRPGLGDEQVVDRGECTIDALAGADRLRLGEDPTPFRYDRAPGVPVCFADREGAAVMLSGEGSGRIVSLVDGTPFQNQYLDADDNAVVATALLAPRPGTRVAVLTGAAFPGQGGSPSVTGAIDRLLGAYPAVGFVLIQIGVALAVLALVAGRRLGQPVAEPQPVQIAGSSLVDAVGHLLRQRRDPEASAAVLRAEARRAVAERSGLHAGVAPMVLAEALSARTGRSAGEALAVLDGPPIASDAELVALADQIDAVLEEVTHGRSP
jgi:hypothetical protein